MNYFTIKTCFPASSSAISAFISKARSQCIAVDNETCLSVEEFKLRIRSWGGDVKPEISVTEFMSSKKGYEVSSANSAVLLSFVGFSFHHS